MAFSPGLYKVKFNGRYHLLRVSIIGGRKMYKLDQIPYEPIERLQETEGYMELICKVNENTISNNDIVQPRITISWQDQEQREFRMTVRDVWAFRGILLEFPFLKTPFQYTPRRKK